MRRADITWTAQTLDAFLQSPTHLVPGTRISSRLSEPAAAAVAAAGPRTPRPQRTAAPDRFRLRPAGARPAHWPGLPARPPPPPRGRRPGDAGVAPRPHGHRPAARAARPPDPPRWPAAGGRAAARPPPGGRPPAAGGADRAAPCRRRPPPPLPARRTSGPVPAATSAAAPHAAWPVTAAWPAPHPCRPRGSGAPRRPARWRSPPARSAAAGRCGRRGRAAGG
ncbi:hypothetical protein G6F50_015159 [Rhizopus delemar]|uniref:Uncharacterized protein n=1 Tax=Rhizopus delemar TaxID=936053 RepID=A0A9P6XZW5_9FUNG|nr:hypothetical protein G6F50_015159 [Rhizopus delemar]